MKIALITDTHWGARGDSPTFLKYFRKFYDNIFFPYLEKHNIKTCIHLGDVVDRRKYINFKILNDLRTNFIERLWKMGVDTHIIIGNHDTFHKNTNDLNSIEEIFTTAEGKVEPWMYSSPKEVDFDGLGIVMMPWICEDNYGECMKMIQNTQCQILMGHLQVSGFEQHIGSWNNEGLEAHIFDKFDMALSGHFHHRSNNGTVYYLGNPYEITWSDYKDPRGFHIFDTDKRQLNFIMNPYRMFHKIFYDDSEETFESLTEKDYSEYEGTYVKVVVEKKTNPFWFDTVLDKLEEVNVADLVVVENFSDFDINDDDIIDQAEDTLTILGGYVESLNVENKVELDGLMRSLYNEALTVEAI